MPSRKVRRLEARARRPGRGTAACAPWARPTRSSRRSGSASRRTPRSRRRGSGSTASRWPVPSGLRRAGAIAGTPAKPLAPGRHVVVVFGRSGDRRDGRRLALRRRVRAERLGLGATWRAAGEGPSLVVRARPGPAVGSAQRLQVRQRLVVGELVPGERPRRSRRRSAARGRAPRGRCCAPCGIAVDL